MVGKHELRASQKTEKKQNKKQTWSKGTLLHMTPLFNKYSLFGNVYCCQNR